MVVATKLSAAPGAVVAGRIVASADAAAGPALVPEMGNIAAGMPLMAVRMDFVAVAAVSMVASGTSLEMNAAAGMRASMPTAGMMESVVAGTASTTV
jgi:hypothetical protein